MTGWYEEKNKQKNSLPDLDFRQSYKHTYVHRCLNHIFGSTFPAAENYSLYHFYGTFQWSDKVIRGAFF